MYMYTFVLRNNGNVFVLISFGLDSDVSHLAFN